MTKTEALQTANQINRETRSKGIALETGTMAFAMAAKEGWTVVLPKREG